MQKIVAKLLLQKSVVPAYAVITHCSIEKREKLQVIAFLCAVRRFLQKRHGYYSLS